MPRKRPLITEHSPHHSMEKLTRQTQSLRSRLSSQTRWLLFCLPCWIYCVRLNTVVGPFSSTAHADRVGRGGVGLGSPQQWNQVASPSLSLLIYRNTITSFLPYFHSASLQPMSKGTAPLGAGARDPAWTGTSSRPNHIFKLTATLPLLTFLLNS